MVKREAATTVSHEEAARIAIPTDYTLGRGWLGRGRLDSLGLGRLDKLLAVSILAATRRGYGNLPGCPQRRGSRPKGGKSSTPTPPRSTRTIRMAFTH